MKVLFKIIQNTIKNIFEDFLMFVTHHLMANRIVSAYNLNDNVEFCLSLRQHGPGGSSQIRRRKVCDENSLHCSHKFQRPKRRRA